MTEDVAEIDEVPVTLASGSAAKRRRTLDGSTLTLCPVCEVEVRQEVIVAHVNSCLDDEAFPLDFDIPSPPPSPPLFSELDGDNREQNAFDVSTDAPEGPRKREKETESDSCRLSAEVPILNWLRGLGLAKYTPGFLIAGFRTLDSLVSSATIGEDRLRDLCGVKAIGARKKIASELALVKSRTAVANPLLVRDASAPSASCTSVQQRQQNDAPDAKQNVWAIFQPGCRVAASPPSPPSRGLGQSQLAGSANGAARRGPRQHAFSHRVPGTAFTVDSFYAVGSDSCTQYLLSHFHSDHYGPLKKTTLPEGSKVLCTSVTASLVHKLLRVPKERIKVLPLHTAVELCDGISPRSGATVTLFPANHCPGAAIMLFHVWSTKRFVLHCGDCRFDLSTFSRYKKLAQVIEGNQLDYLFLDTTYCNPSYTFPHQDHVLAEVVCAARDEDRRTRGRCLFFFGTYSIGKEKVFFAVAEALNLNIYANERKRSILNCCEFGSRLSSRLVSNPGQARVHVVPMRSLSADGLREYASRNKLNKSFIGCGLAVVFRPTGWTFKGEGTGVRRASRSTDQAITYEVAYSEHSSFEELQGFVRWSRPARLIPTVNARSAADADKLKALLAHKDRPLS